ncbi:MAG: non-canonical purine NTP pyrophosphatase [Candidatus Pacebacteria bacterium]|nr:non-canonical purine NTP pyrophosphatase [Candidatus Paceibacterota bacterium]
MKFITGNKGKFNEVQSLLPNIKQLDIDLPEIQSLNPKDVIKVKINEALKYIQSEEEIIVEDTSVVFHEMNNLPGTFIKFFVDDLGVDGIWNLVKNFNNKDATARTIFGYLDPHSNIHYFEGIIDGKIIEPKGSGFGFDPLFKPNASKKTFGEMTQEEKKMFNMRVIAINKLIEHRKKAEQKP